jgi:rubrerythrin
MDPLTKMHVLTIIAAEQQTMNYYMNVGNRFTERLARGLYQEIGQIEEQHVSHYESLEDPTSSWFEMLVLHEYNECYMYYSCMESEVDGRVKGIWQQMLDDEIEHLRISCDLMKQYENRDPQECLPKELPQLTIFQSNKDYVRDIIASQVDLTAKETEFVNPDELSPDFRYFEFQRIMNSDSIPSQDVVEEHIRRKGQDYRLETEGPHPVERMRSKESVVI